MKTEGTKGRRDAFSYKKNTRACARMCACLSEISGPFICLAERERGGNRRRKERTRERETERATRRRGAEEIRLNAL